MTEFVWNGKTYQIGKKTVDVSEAMDDIIDMSTLEGKEEKRKAFKAEYDFIINAMGEDAAKEALDCTSFNDVDVEVLITLFNAVGYAWQKVRRDFSNRQTEEVLDDPSVAKAKELANAAEKIQSLM